MIRENKRILTHNRKPDTNKLETALSKKNRMGVFKWKTRNL